MPNKCVVPGCKTGYASCKVKLSTFSAPKDDELRKRWEAAVLPKNPLTPKHVVCETHFQPNLVIRNTTLKDASGNVLLEVPLQCARLVENAVPTLFFPRKVKVDQEKSSDKEIMQGNQIVTIEQFETFTTSNALIEVTIDEQNQQNSESVVENNEITHPSSLFDELVENPSLICLPENWHLATPLVKTCFAFYELEWLGINTIFPITRRSIVIGKDMKSQYVVNGKCVDSFLHSFPTEFNDLKNINETLEKFASLNICSGVSMPLDVSLINEKIGYTDSFNILRHNRCPIVTEKRQCEACKSVKKLIGQKKLRMKKREQIGVAKLSSENREKAPGEKSRADVWKAKLRSRQSALTRAKKKINVLKSLVHSRQAEVTKLREDNVLRKCEELDMPDAQRMCVKEIMLAAKKKDSKGFRYTDEWVMLCILMHIRSPSCYNFLRKNGVLPLPCVRTIRRYRSLFDIKCDYDEPFVNVLKKYIRAKEPTLEKQRILVDSEISGPEDDSEALLDLTEGHLNTHQSMLEI